MVDVEPYYSSKKSYWDEYVKSMPGGEWIGDKWRATPLHLGWVQSDAYPVEIALAEFGIGTPPEQFTDPRPWKVTTGPVLAPLFVFETIDWLGIDGEYGEHMAHIAWDPSLDVEHVAATMWRMQLSHERYWTSLDYEGAMLTTVCEIVAEAAAYGVDPCTIVEVLPVDIDTWEISATAALIAGNND